MHSFRTQPLCFAAITMTALLSSHVHAQHRLCIIDQFGTERSDAPLACTPDGAGGVFTTGFIDAKSGGNGEDLWIARYNIGSGLLWFEQFGSDTDERAKALAPDGLGGVFVGGYTEGDLVTPNPGTRDGWIARYDAAGTQTWLRQIGTALWDDVRAMVSDDNGGFFAAGYAGGNFGGPHAGNVDAWVGRFDAAGEALWISQFGTVDLDQANALAPDGAGGVFVAGTTWGDLAAPNKGGADVWIARYDAAGAQMWLLQDGTSENDDAMAIAPDASGGVFVAGHTFGAFGGAFLGDRDGWIARHDASGTRKWVRQFGSSVADVIYGAAEDGAGGVFVSGYTNGELALPSTGEADAFLVRFDDNGEQIANRQYGTSKWDSARALAFKAEGEVFMAGSTQGILGGSSAGAGDVWVGLYTATCYPDGDQSTGPGVLDIFDFLNFQNSFVAGEAYACDCDLTSGPGVCDVFDFLCFQNMFVCGCP